MFLGAAKITKLLESFLTILKQPQQHGRINVVRIAERIAEAIKRGKIEGSIMDSRTMKRFESEDDS